MISAQLFDDHHQEHQYQVDATCWLCMLRRLQHNRLITIMVNIIIKLTIQHQRGTAHMAKCNMGRRLSLSMWAGGDLSPQLRHYPQWKAHFSGSSSQRSSSLPVRHELRCLGSSSLTGMARCGVPQFAKISPPDTLHIAKNRITCCTHIAHCFVCCL